MASIINASTSGVGGVITTADNSGDLNIQSGGATKIAVTSTGAAVTGTLSASSTVSGTNITTGGNVTGSSTSCTGNATTATTATTATALSTASGSAPSYSNRVWVGFSGSTINASGNVSSVTVNSTGVYTVNFTTALPNAGYAVVYSAGNGNATGNFIHTEAPCATYSTSAVQVKSWNFNGTPVSYTYNSVIIAD